MSQTSEIFDRQLLHARRARQVRRLDGDALPDFLLAHAVDDVMERLAMIKRRFSRALSLGSYHGLMARRLRAAGIEDVVETDAVAEWTMTAIQSEPIPGRVPVATGNPITLNGVTLIHVDGGKITHAADYLDALGFVLQLGSEVALPGGIVLKTSE